MNTDIVNSNVNKKIYLLNRSVEKRVKLKVKLVLQITLFELNLILYTFI